MEKCSDKTTIAMHKGLVSALGMDKNQVRPSDSLWKAYCAVEGPITTHIPQIYYDGVKHIDIPRNFDKEDPKMTGPFSRECRDCGLCNEDILGIINMMDNYRQWEYDSILAHVQSTDFDMLDGDTVEDVIESMKDSHFPLTIFTDKAVQFDKPRETYCKQLNLSIFSIRASMPPHHLSGPHYGSYIETCMSAMCREERALTNRTIAFFGYHIITEENMIVFFLCFFNQ